jgi:uncharacterized SAM-binding protein YcdF (DUF218 family)
MTDDEITELLFVREAPAKADLAMVFAAANELDLAHRTRRGAALYHEGFAAKLLVTGGGVLAGIRPETKRMKDIAREHRVPDEDLLVEDRSSNSFDNVRFSLELLEQRDLLRRLSTVILVSSEWHMRRVLLTMKAFFPGNLRFLCCPTTEGCTRENWRGSQACRREVMREALLLETFLETGAI